MPTLHNITLQLMYMGTLTNKEASGFSSLAYVMKMNTHFDFLIFVMQIELKFLGI